ncbi:putative RNA-directed DNA polymerase from transposon X-element [Trichonephila inaurata madagascariensis]|uniref:Putative RNA-directed DNA polymerase from transposon X-element n=1 Tax=Trichonephila inaurata madagascariensis TaxID=2747483 RepID=A0A8X6X6S6_9ARAC|nr:putative RNA-directed DNA polymerase from transposon X-element [Trichonephila inaurata madagascariensis]
MPIEDKRKLLAQKHACFRCLKIGHVSRSCKYKVKCLSCDKSHYTIMCADRESAKSNDENTVVSSSVLSNQSVINETVYLRTLVLKIEHNVEVLSQKKICGFVPKIVDLYTLQELKEKNITLSDLVTKEHDIELLLGEDVIGNILIGNSLKLSSGVTVVQTKFGYTVIEKTNTIYNNLYINVVSLYCANFTVTDLWNLDAIGITDPTEDAKRKHAHSDFLNQFKENLSVLPDGRYELPLPFKFETQLPNNKSATIKRHKRTCQRIDEQNQLNDYEKTFRKWRDETQYLEKIDIPRYVEINENSELHLFVDACKSSYGACVYVQTVTPLGFKIRLIRARSRVEPLKILTIPRLELMACCTSARLVQAVFAALDLPDLKIVAWSDSMVALWWLKNHGDWSVFVANRVNEINSLVPSQFCAMCRAN